MRRSLFGLLGLFAVPVFLIAQTSQKPRVFITDSHSWEVSGGGGGVEGTFGAQSTGGARPQTAEIIKTFGERCPQVIVNNRREKADYIVLLDHEGGKGFTLHDNKVAVFNGEGDSILGHSTRTLGNAVKDACDAISKDWPSRANRAGAQTASDDSIPGSRVSVSSNPQNADIVLDGSFVGNTPSVIAATPGEHLVVVRKPGYKNWERKVKVTGGTVNLSAELEKE